MRMHSDIITETDFHNAAKRAGVTIEHLSVHGSRTRARAFKFYLSGSGRNGGQWGAQDYQTATWDEWGIFLGHLFARDAFAHCGRNSYIGADDYHWQTGDRFHSLTPDEQCKRHKWESLMPYVHECSKCNAIRRWSVQPKVIVPSVQAKANAYRKLAGVGSEGIRDDAAAWAYEQMNLAS